MTATYEKPYISKTEVYALSKAGDELYQTGRTDIRCPRCGKAIVLDELPYPVRCSDPRCVKLTARGL